ncbi:hypothetical protein GEMRC1_003737 [Eukaryota sp. GEM-RC1]
MSYQPLTLSLESVGDIEFGSNFSYVYWINDFLLCKRDSFSFVDHTGERFRPPSFLRPLTSARVLSLSQNGKYIIAGFRSNSVSLFFIDKELSLCLPQLPNLSSSSFCGMSSLFSPCSILHVCTSNDGILSSVHTADSSLFLFCTTSDSLEWIPLTYSSVSPFCFNFGFSRKLNSGPSLTITSASCTIDYHSVTITAAVGVVSLVGTFPSVSDDSLVEREVSKQVVIELDHDVLKEFGLDRLIENQSNLIVNFDHSYHMCTITSSFGVVITFPPSIIFSSSFSNHDVIRIKPDCSSIIDNLFLSDSILIYFIKSLPFTIVDHCFGLNGLYQFFILSSGSLLLFTRGLTQVRGKLGTDSSQGHHLVSVMNARRSPKLFPHSTGRLLLVSDGSLASVLKICLPHDDIESCLKDSLQYWVHGKVKVSLVKRVVEFWVLSTSCSVLVGMRGQSELIDWFLTELVSSSAVARLVYSLLYFDYFNQNVAGVVAVLMKLLDQSNLIDSDKLTSELHVVYHRFLQNTDLPRCISNQKVSVFELFVPPKGINFDWASFRDWASLPRQSDGLLSSLLSSF